MTAQINNIFKLDNREYDIVGLSKDIDFSPRDFGLKPVAPHTAAWKGYYYEASIRDNQLVILNLHVNDYDNNYPDINGVMAVDRVSESSFFTYFNVNIPLDYTGKILLGNDFNKKYYRHMGYQSPHGYENLLLITFKEGRFLDMEDLSEKAKMERDEIDNNPDELNRVKSVLKDYIENSFSMDIEDKYL